VREVRDAAAGVRVMRDSVEPAVGCRTNHAENDHRRHYHVMMKKISVRTLRLGNITRHAPSTPAIAPEAQVRDDGFGPTASCPSVAAIPPQ
jgi:hypothetical protein